MLSRLGLFYPLLGGLQVLLVVLLMTVGLLPSRVADIALAQWGSVWLGSASAAALIVLGGFRRRTCDTAPHGSDESLTRAIPLQVTHECVLLPRGRHYLAVGFVTLASRSNTDEDRSVLESLYRAGVPTMWVLARTVDQQDYVCLAIPSLGETAELATEGAIRASQVLRQALSESGVQAQWVRDELGVEQLYWLCVLGNAFHEDVLLRCEGRLVATRVGANPLRLLAAFDLRPDTLEETRPDRRPAGLLQLADSSRPFFLAIALKPVPPEEVAQQLRRLAANAPEMTLLAEALTETAALQAYAQFQAPAMAEAVTLLRGRREGLWQTGFRLICAVADAPVLMQGFALTPRLLGGSGFAETAAMQMSFLKHPVATTAVLDLLGHSRGQNRSRRERHRIVLAESGSEED